MPDVSPQGRRLLPRIAHSLPLVSLIVAALSLASSISQSFNYARNIEAAQQNVLRVENLKSCREIIEVFFAFRLRAEEAHAARVPGDAAARREMKRLVYRFGAIGTYIANFAPEAMRERYTAMSWQLDALIDKALAVDPAFEAEFAKADTAFGTLNEDCAKAAQFVKLG